MVGRYLMPLITAWWTRQAYYQQLPPWNQLFSNDALAAWALQHGRMDLLKGYQFQDMTVSGVAIDVSDGSDDSDNSRETVRYVWPLVQDVTGNRTFAQFDGVIFARYGAGMETTLGPMRYGVAPLHRQQLSKVGKRRDGPSSIGFLLKKPRFFLLGQQQSPMNKISPTDFLSTYSFGFPLMVRDMLLRL